MKPETIRVVITGASSGIGAATAIAFARQGASLLLGARGEEGLADVARRCREAGGRAEFALVDVTDADAVARFAGRARKVLGGIDLWFSNVGIGAVGKYLDVPLADHHRVIDANLVGHMNDAYAVLPIFRDQGHGIWVNMISVGGFIASPYAAAYTASKFALRGFSQALRGELHDDPNIHVCDVYPTFVDTPAIYHAANYTGARLKMPPGAMAPERVAEAVVALARKPRATTVVGAPASALELGQFAAPVSASLMDRFMDRWTRRAAPAADTSGTFYAPPVGASGIRSGMRGSGPGSSTGAGTDTDTGMSTGAGAGGHNKAALALGATLLAALGLQLLRRRA